MSATKLKTISFGENGQRVDNLLIKHFKGVPKSRIYRALRAGEVRVNKKRVKADYRLQEGDILRLPPLRVPDKGAVVLPSDHLVRLLVDSIFYENEGFIIINKPIGIAAHGGTNIAHGAVEILRAAKPDFTELNLVHRIDRATSGCMLLAKNRLQLNKLNTLIKEKQMIKRYLAVVKGHFPDNITDITFKLEKFTLKSGERMITVGDQGQSAHTRCKVLRRLDGCTLVEAQPITGRTHQLRVHFAELGHPIAGDEKYGQKDFNKAMRGLGLKRMFLHAAALEFYDQDLNEKIALCASLDAQLSAFLKAMLRAQCH